MRSLLRTHSRAARARPQVMVPMAFMSPFAVLFIYVWDSGTVKYDKKLTVGGEPLKYSKE